MNVIAKEKDLKCLVSGLNFAEKIERSLELLGEAHRQFGDRMVVANSLGKDSAAVWHLAQRVNPKVRGFVVTTRFKPATTRLFMEQEVARHPGLKVFSYDGPLPDEIYKTDPDRCCEILKVQTARRAIEEMGAACWVTGLRCTEGRTRTDFEEIEERDEGLRKLNPILIWDEREVWEYLAIHQVPVNPLYAEGYRSLGCEPCTRISTAPDERAGRWMGTSKCGGECGIHTRSLKTG